MVMMDVSIVCLSLLTLSLTFILLLLLLYLSIFHTHHQNQSNTQTPCPQSYPLIGNLIGFLRNRHRFHDWVSDMLSTTPSLTLQVNGFLGLSHGIATANPANVDHLLHANFSNYVKATRFQAVLDELLGHGIFNVDGELWLAQRKIASYEFNTKSLKHFISSTVESQLCSRLIPYLSSACHDQRVIDLQDVLRRFTFDNICNVAFGVDPQWLVCEETTDRWKNSSFVHAFDYAVEVCSDRFMSPLPVIWKIKRLLNLGNEKRFREAIQIINDFVLNIIISKEGKEQEPNQDLLSRFMNSSSSLGFRVPDEKRKFLRDIVISFILAGKDSTSTALTWFFWLISGHPRCERLICNELMEAVAASGGENHSEKFRYDELKKLHYLQAAISESLRLFPPVPINSRLVLSSDTLSSSATNVGKGWFADYSAYAMGRMERLWGENCMEFRPERWLNDAGVFQPCDQFKFPVFHCGPRMCLGKDMAYVQMKSVAAAVMYEFEVVAVDGGGGPERIRNPPYTLSLLLKMKGGLPVRLNRRRLPKISSKLDQGCMVP